MVGASCGGYCVVVSPCVRCTAWLVHRVVGAPCGICTVW